MASGTAGAQLTAAGFAPVLTRMYGPTAFGVLGAFLAVVAILSHIAGATYPIAIVLPTDDREARGLAKLALWISFGMAFMLALLIAFAGASVDAWLGMRGIAGLAFLLPVTMVLTTAVSISRQWLIRKHLFAVTAKAAVIQAIANNIAKVAIGFVSPLAIVLVGAATAAPAVHILLMWPGLKDLVKPDDGPRMQISQQFTELRAIAKKYKDFPLYRAPQHLLNSFGQGLPTILLATTFGAASAGFYAISQTVMGLPSVLIGKSVGDVFYPRISRAVDEGANPRRLIVKATLALGLVGLIPFGIIALFGPFLFQLVFGREWLVAGEYARWLSMFFFLNLINKPSVAAIPPLGLQKHLLVYEVFATAAKVAGLVFGFYYLHSQVAAVALFSIAGTVAYALLILYVIAKSRAAVRHEADRYS